MLLVNYCSFLFKLINDCNFPFKLVKDCYFPFSGQQMLETFEKQLQEEEKRCEDSSDRLDKSSKILISATAGVDHLAEKLKHLKTVSEYNVNEV